MTLPSLMRRISCLLLLTLAAFAAHAAPLNLPPSAVTDDTFFIVTIDLAKLDPATLEATAKAALGEKAADVDNLLSTYKTQYERFAGKGVESVAVVLRGDPGQQKEPEPIFYVRFKRGTDHAAVEKQVRDTEGETSPDVLEITHDGDFMLLRAKGIEPPQASSEARTKLFSDALAGSDKPVVAVVIFNDAMIKGIKKAIEQGAPPGVQTLMEDSKSIRIDAALGDGVKAEVVIETADEDAATRLMGALAGFGEMMKAQVVEMKQALAPPVAVGQPRPQMASMGELADAVSVIAEAFKPQQSGTKIKMSADAKVVGAMLKAVTISEGMTAANAPANKGGL